MSSEWYYLDGGRRVGPVTERELLEALAAHLSAQTSVWHPGLPGWTRAADVPELRDRIPPPLPSVPPASPTPSHIPAQGRKVRPSLPPEPLSEPPRSSNPFVLYGRCFTFWRGSLSRKEYTILIVTALVATFGGGIALAILYAVSGATPGQMEALMGDVMKLIWLVCGLPPVLGGTIKRLRDVGKTPWYMLVFLIPCAGFVMIVLLMAEKGARDAPQVAQGLSSVRGVGGGQEARESDVPRR